MSGKNRTTPTAFLKLFSKEYFGICRAEQQERVAKHCGITKQAVYQWVRGMNAIPLFRFIQFCEFYEMDAGQEISRLVRKWKIINKTIGGKKNGKK